MKNIFLFSLENESRLGFDTGLDAPAFARAKTARFITRRGFLVRPGGETEEWRCGGIVEREGPGGQRTMVFWGPGFSGSSLDELTAPGKRDEALDALRWWLRARRLLAGEEDLPPPWPGGAFLSGGTVFFAPEDLVKRSLEAEGAWARGAADWVNPALTGKDAEAFTAGALLYRVFCGRHPFSPEPFREGTPLLMREALFVPPRLEAPGLTKEAAEILDRCLTAGRGGRAISPAEIEAFLGPPGGTPFSSWFTAPEEEAGVSGKKRARFIRKNGGRLKRRVFFSRHRNLLVLSLAAFLSVLFAARGVVKAQAGRPSTRGMDPPEVAESYYRAFNLLDHDLMSACTSNSAGKADIDLAVNFFVINRVRSAYEGNAAFFIPAEEWIAGGSPPADRAVFGVAGLSIRAAGDARSGEGGNPGEAVFEAEYRLYVPGSAPDSSQSPGTGPEGPGEVPVPVLRKDRLTLTQKRGLWRISRIEREQSGGNDEAAHGSGL
jgi:hypothetical protein